ncbi:MAG: hypothetical protein HY273_03750 [Gammaproteobacteria bacterium]|nr:hypothetical protein [Gammaproteobacteria bacterium]
MTKLEADLPGGPQGENQRRLVELSLLQDEAVIAAQYHHAPDYRAEDAVYAHLVGLAEGLLHRQGVISDADTKLSDITLALLGLNDAAIEKAAQPVLDACAELDTLSQLLSR